MKTIIKVPAFILIALLFSQNIHAQYFQFGKNRVQYTELEWRFIQSEHFDIYYYDAKNYELAEFTALSLESALKQLSEDFKHQIVDRIPVIVYDSHNDFSQTNVVALPLDAEGIGGVTDKLKNRITIPFDGNYADFRRVLHHELVHAVFNDMFYGGSLQSIISNNIQLVFPLWFEEGLAEFTAQGWDTQTDMFIREAIIDGDLPPLQRLGGFYNYRGGQSLWNFIAEEYGREKIAEILNRIRITRSVQAGFVRSLGLTIPELSDRWQEALKKRYFPEVAEREKESNIATKLTGTGDRPSYDTSPAISPQGDKIAMITTSDGLFDISVISSLDGRRLKKLLDGQESADFEELNILNPNLTWSPDGQKIAFSTKSRGGDDIAIIDYNTLEIEKLKFPKLDAIGSVAWSPDGKKLAFDGNVGPFQDIFVYNFETKEFLNVTGDFYTDVEPEWGNDSQSIYFVSQRGEMTNLHTYTYNHNLLLSNYIYTSDIYKLELGSRKAIQLTKTPGWNEKRPQVSMTGRMMFVSDKNGIPNIYEFNLNTRSANPLTNVQTGIEQISLSADGSRVAFNALDNGLLDIYLLKSPFTRVIEGDLTDNYWAKRRQEETPEQRVPAIAYVKQMYGQGIAEKLEEQPADVQTETANQVNETDEEQSEENKEGEEEASSEIDFRNYVFAQEVIEDSTLGLVNQDRFEPEDNLAEDGRYQPRKYRLEFSTDITYAGGQFSTTFGSLALTQIIVSDLLGDHQLSFGSNLVFDLRNSDYSIQYGYLKNRTNYFAQFFHSAQQFQTFFGELLRFRTYGGGINVQYPFDKFRRIDFGLSGIVVRRDFSTLFDDIQFLTPPGQEDENDAFAADNELNSFLYPTATYTSDHTRQGFITPRGGARYSIGLSGSPGLGSGAPTFFSALGDFRKYFDMGSRYTFAVRGSGAFSTGKDAQTYFLGGRLGWINRRFSNNEIPFDRLSDTFFTLPALPLRGYEFNAIQGNKFALINSEFRFPLFAALLPGPVPIIPLYNITGAAFVDVGTAWGFGIDYEVLDENGNRVTNSKDLDFKLGEERIGLAVDDNNNPITDAAGNTFQRSFIDGDILVGAGFGLRTILLGLPFRYDVGWPYFRNGFGDDPIHYFSIGIDF